MKRYASCCAYKTEGVNHLDLSPTPDKCGALTTRPDVRENAKKTGNFFVMEYLAVYALDGAKDGYVAVQPDQKKSNTVSAASHINKTFEGTTRIMEYEEIDDKPAV